MTNPMMPRPMTPAAIPPPMAPALTLLEPDCVGAALAVDDETVPEVGNTDDEVSVSPTSSCVYLGPGIRKGRYKMRSKLSTDWRYWNSIKGLSVAFAGEGPERVAVRLCVVFSRPPFPKNNTPHLYGGVL